MIFKKIKILTFSILISLLSVSQIDSLQNALVTANNSEKANIYNQLAFYTMDATGIAGIKFANKAIEFAKQNNQLEEESYAYIMLGSCYIYKSEFQNAMQAFLNAEKLALTLNNTCHLQMIYTNIGIIYRYTDQVEFSIEYNSKALSNAIQCGDLAGIIQTYISIGNTYTILEDYTNGKTYFQKAIDKIEGRDTLLSCLGGLYNNIGYINFMQENYELAEDSYYQAYQVFNKVNNFQGMGSCLNNIAQIRMISKDFDRAEVLINQADSLHKLNDFKESRKSLYLTSFELFYENGNYEKAIFYLQEYHKLKDSIYNENLDKEIQELKTKYEVDQITAESLTNELKLNQQKRINVILILAILLVSLFLLITFILFRQKQKLSIKLVDRNKLLQLKDEEISNNLLYARRIQANFMNSNSTFTHIEYFTFDKPKSIVGGDFYLFKQKENKTFVACADSTGHGVSGAFLSILGIEYLTQSINQNYKLSDILNLLNHNFLSYITESNNLGSESLCISLISIEKNILEFSGSKHKIWHYNSIHKSLSEYKTDSHIIGNNTPHTFQTQKIELAKGDLIFLSSDGFPDQFGENNQGKYKYQQFRQLLEKCSSINFSHIPQILDKELESWRGQTEQTDDILVIGIKIS